MKHDWIAIATFELEESEAIRAIYASTEGVAADPPIALNAENSRAISVGCYRCEEVGSIALIGTECRGEPS